MMLKHALNSLKVFQQTLGKKLSSLEKSEGNQNKLELFTSYPKNNQQEFPLLEKSQIKF